MMRAESSNSGRDAIRISCVGAAVNLASSAGNLRQSMRVARVWDFCWCGFDDPTSNRGGKLCRRTKVCDLVSTDEVPTSWRRNHVEQQALTDQRAHTSVGHSTSNVVVITCGCRFAVLRASLVMYRPLEVVKGVLYMNQSGCGATSHAGSPHRSARFRLSPPSTHNEDRVESA